MMGWFPTLREGQQSCTKASGSLWHHQEGGEAVPSEYCRKFICSKILSFARLLKGEDETKPFLDTKVTHLAHTPSEQAANCSTKGQAAGPPRSRQARGVGADEGLLSVGGPQTQAWWEPMLPGPPLRL